MSPTRPPSEPSEPWSAWEARVAGDLAALTGAEWLSFTPAPRTVAQPTSSAEAPTRRRRWRRAPAAGGTVPEVFLQAMVLEGVLALEMIGDTEFEGLTDLSATQQSALVEAGWDQEGADPTFSRTFVIGDATAAAALLSATLHGVLQIEDPASVELRRS
ncbi:MAG: hypothetical protein ABIS35_08155 [Terracoccus sp.]